MGQTHRNSHHHLSNASPRLLATSCRAKGCLAALHRPFPASAPNYRATHRRIDNQSQVKKCANERLRVASQPASQSLVSQSVSLCVFVVVGCEVCLIPHSFCVATPCHWLPVMIFYSNFSWWVVRKAWVLPSALDSRANKQTTGAPRRDLQGDLGEWRLSQRFAIRSSQEINTVKTEMVMVVIST
ncbi:hypothetical protein E2C01_042321 [Portunus trituberculatus]|uniref:Uncharacterized protein n=1 Tax=Portunus trituberculatus TaxID=210409 RepID=A0A5B7FTB3_PORTR|nr:hypothetical protein [Portunus trituberculatus]